MSRLRTAIATCLLVIVAASPVAASWDSDGDGLSNKFESKYGVTSPNNPDTDGDCVVDSAEDNDNDRVGNRGEQKFGLNPGQKDTDDDGIKDGVEDYDKDGRSNAVEQDHRPVPAGLTPKLWQAIGDVSPYKAGCQTTAGKSNVVTCSYGRQASPTTVVLMGDSHAMQLATPIVTVAEENGWHLTTLVKKACPPVLGIHNNAQKWADDGKSCRKWRWNALAWLNQNPPDHIILAHSDNYGISTFAGERISTKDRPAVWKSGMKRTIAQMPQSSNVIVFGDIPLNKVNPVGCLQRNKKNISKCVTSRKPLYKRKIELAIEQAARNKGATFRRFFNKICTYDPCPVIQGDVMIYRDKGHLTATFTRQLTPTFRKMLTPLIGTAPAGKKKK